MIIAIILGLLLLALLIWVFVAFILPALILLGTAIIGVFRGTRDGFKDGWNKGKKQ